MNALIRTRRGLLSLGLLGTGCLSAGMASANTLMGPFPYDFPSRSSESALILYESKKAGSLGEGSETNIGEYTINTGSSTSIGNWQQIEQTLSDGSTGTIDGNADQSVVDTTQTTTSDFTTNESQSDDDEE